MILLRGLILLAKDIVKDSLRSGLMPVINSMAIAGVVSWSPHQKGLCGYKPGVYTRISEVRKWIKRKTQV